MKCFGFVRWLIWSVIAIENFLANSVCQFLTGNADIYVVSNDTEGYFEPYSLIYEGSRMYKLSEYVLCGIHPATEFHIVYYDKLNLIDITTALTVEQVRRYTVRQNLEKEMIFAHFNSSGIFPQMVISNTTQKEVIVFHANEKNNISYIAVWVKGTKPSELSPPYDILIEVPGYSHSMQTRRTLIDIQSIPVLRYHFGYSDPVTFNAIVENVESLLPVSVDKHLIWNLTTTTVKMIHNPCTPDFFLVYMMVGTKGTSSRRQKRPSPVYTYYQIPAYYSAGNDGCWHNITSVYCPTLDYQAECGNPENIVLTNHHLLILTSKGLFVSNSLQNSKYRLSQRETAAPFASFISVDPCRGIHRCFQVDSKSQEQDLIYSRKLYYTPFCTVYHYPMTQDIVIFVLEHTKLATAEEARAHGFNASVPLKSFSVTFAAQPYTKWSLLFKEQTLFEGRPLKEIVGIFYNLHLNRFDLTVKVGPKVNSSEVRDRFTRFVLPMPEDKVIEGHKELDGTWSYKLGFMVHTFSESFQITGVAVNPGTMDVFFYGSEIHIAESARSIVYEAIVGFEDSKDYVTGCHFNHPDRFYVCTLALKFSILIGRVATWYGPVEVELGGLSEIHGLVDSIFAVHDKRTFSANNMNLNKDFQHSEASKEVMFYIMDRAFFTASYSGKIYLWYFSDPDYFLLKMKDYDNECRNPKPSCRYPVISRPEKIPGVKYKYECGMESCYTLPCFLPLIMDPLEFQVQNYPTNGPLVPFFVGTDTVILYEAFVPGTNEALMRYLTFVSIGQKIFCHKAHYNGTAQREYTCDLYFRHFKLLGSSSQRLLPGFRSAVYATVVTPPPLMVIHDFLIVQMPEDTNRVRILCADSTFTKYQSCKSINASDTGGTIYIPGHFSVLLLGPDWQVSNAFRGYATHKTVLPILAKIESRKSFKAYFRAKVFLQHAPKYKEDVPFLPPNGTYGCNKNPPIPCSSNPAPFNLTELQVPEWEIGDGGCQFEMALLPNSLIHTSGGKIDLDLHESVSFQVSIRSLSPLGQKMMYRPLLAVTQSNPDVLKVSTSFAKKSDRQILSVFMTPAGSKAGVTSLVVRSVVSSISCKSPSSFTLFVQCVRAEGRKLTAKYPEKVLKEDTLSDPLQQQPKNKSYVTLPINYRPPSAMGVDIPLTPHVYNADPSKPLYRSLYERSKESARFKQCHVKRNRAECECLPDMKTSTDPAYSDCIEKVLKVARNEEFAVSLTYPPRQTAADQMAQFYTPPSELTLSIEEINGRSDYSLEGSTNHSSFLNVINHDLTFNKTKTYYSASNIIFRLSGTGLYHFKATLGSFHTLGEVSQYILVYSHTSELDDVLLVVIVVLTITICFLFVVFSFLRIRYNLIAHYPPRTEAHLKQKSAFFYPFLTMNLGNVPRSNFIF